MTPYHIKEEYKSYQEFLKKVRKRRELSQHSQLSSLQWVPENQRYTPQDYMGWCLASLSFILTAKSSSQWRIPNMGMRQFILIANSTKKSISRGSKKCQIQNFLVNLTNHDDSVGTMIVWASVLDFSRVPTCTEIWGFACLQSKINAMLCFNCIIHWFFINKDNTLCDSC